VKAYSLVPAIARLHKNRRGTTSLRASNSPVHTTSYPLASASRLLNFIWLQSPHTVSATCSCNYDIIMLSFIYISNTKTIHRAQPTLSLLHRSWYLSCSSLLCLRLLTAPIHAPVVVLPPPIQKRDGDESHGSPVGTHDTLGDLIVVRQWSLVFWFPMIVDLKRHG
jgi:hypothetical protein